MTNILEERSLEATRITNMHLETLGQLMNANHELNTKNIEIYSIKVANEQLRNDLKREKEFIECFNKFSEAIKYIEQLMRSLRSNKDTFGLGYTSIEEGDSFKSAKERSNKAKNSKPT